MNKYQKVISYIHEWFIFIGWFTLVLLSFLWMTENLHIKYIDDNKTEINIKFVTDVEKIKKEVTDEREIRR